MIQTSSLQKQKQYNRIFLRRFNLYKTSKIHLSGAPKCGKTCVALDFIKNFNNPLYIDFNDYRNSLDLIKSHLLKASMEKKVDILVLDNIPNNYPNLPNINNIITINEYKNKDFYNIEILPLSFEEFISFDTLNQSINQLFDNFIKYGNLPFILHLKDAFKMETKQSALQLIFKNNLNIFILLSQFQSSPITANQIYSIAKKHFKISKDSVYEFIKDLQNRGIIYFAQNFQNQNLSKKLFFWDFSIRNILSYDKNFNSMVENMLFLELLKYKKTIFYSDKINLICNGIGYIIATFSTIEAIKENLLKIDDFLNLEIIVITFGLEGEIYLNNKKIEIKNFINFALDE